MYELSKDRKRLIQSKSAQENKFDFIMDDYAFLAIILMKFDKNLAEVREELVPDEISEEDFW